MLMKLAWRNIWRSKRRSIITILAVTFAVMLSIAMRGLQLGTYEVNIKTAVEMFPGYLQIQKTGYQKNPSLQKSFSFDRELREMLHKEPLITGFTPRIVGDGLISFKDNSAGAGILGIVPETEKTVSEIMSKVNEGRFFQSDSSSDIVIGHTLLSNLKAEIGDTVVVLAQGYDGSLGNLLFKIVGTIKTGSRDFDAGAVFMGLSTARDLMAMYGRVNMVAISLDDLDDIPEVQSHLNRALQNSELTALRWNEIMPDFEQSIQLDNIGGILFLGILVVVVAFGIMNTVLMSVTERFREFGVTLSIGMPQRKLVTQVFIETLFIVLIGIVIGNILAAGINYYIVQNPIVFGGEFAELYAEYGFLPRLESTLKPHIFWNSSLATFLISIFASLYPLSKVYWLEPLKGIRYT
jgi:ABC-type lipoprotein release transport system permease subunit